MNSKQLLPALVQTVSKTKDSFARAIDFSVDVLSDSELLRGVPVLGTAIRMLDVKDAFIASRLKRNCLALMDAAADVTPEEAADLGRHLGEDEAFAEDFADTMLTALYESAKPMKCALVGRLLAAVAKGSLSREDCSDLVLVIQSTSVPALYALPRFYDSNDGKSLSHQHTADGFEPLLIGSGLASRFGTALRISELGEKLFVHGFAGTLTSPTY